MLPYFDGAPVEGTIAQIEAETGIVVQLDLIRKLVDFGVLADEESAQERRQGETGRTPSQEGW